MANVLKITVDNPDELLNSGAYGAGALLRVQSGAAVGGPFSDLSGSGSTPTITIITGTTAYTAYDPNGTSASWYRTRYENVGASRASDWTDPFQVGRQLYADLDDLKEMVQPPDNSKDNLLLDLLASATETMSEFCERDFFRHPQAGTEVRLYEGPGTRRLRVKAGILSLTQVRLRTSGSSAYEVITNYTLGPPDRMATEPYEWLWLDEASTHAQWWAGYGAVELTGQFGWPAVPRMIERATLDLAREMYRSGPGGSLQFAPGQLAVYRNPNTGQPVWGTGLPPSVLAAVNRYSAKSLLTAGGIVEQPVVQV